MSEKRNGPATDVETPKTSRRITAQEVEARTTPDAPPTPPGAMEYDYTNFYFGAGEDAFALL
ncbi:MAG: hypothetical protein PVJ02_16585, partial [Gemmatimonadota bacterium]